MKYAPIALFVYNRPVHACQAIDALLKNPESEYSKVYVFSDGPKNQNDAPAIESVRAALRGIRGFGSVEIIARETNLGLRASLVNGITQLTEAYGRAIIVEDDLRVAPGFLEFMNRGLECYETEDRVYSISGYMYPIETTDLADSVFLPMTSCWGWATWKRAWSHLDQSLSGMKLLEQDSSMRKRFNLNGAYDYFRMAKMQRQGQIDSWGICWHLSAFIKDGLTLYPRQSLVQNFGMDGSGTHYTSTHGDNHSLLHPLIEPIRSGSGTLQLPSNIEIDHVAYRRVIQLLRTQRPNIVAKFANWIRL